MSQPERTQEDTAPVGEAPPPPYRSRLRLTIWLAVMVLPWLAVLLIWNLVSSAF